MSCLVLDAMGVIFRSADDVAELLIPFVAENSTEHDEKAVQAAYLEASLGQIDADDFWVRLGIDPVLEDEFLARHSLRPGVIELLALARENKLPVWCLSNDLGRWSKKLRARLGVEPFLEGVVISGDVGVRKPDVQIYQMLLDACGYRVDQLLFVDDREKNVVTAREIGIPSIWLESHRGFDEVAEWVEKLTE